MKKKFGEIFRKKANLKTNGEQQRNVSDNVNKSESMSENRNNDTSKNEVENKAQNRTSKTKVALSQKMQNLKTKISQNKVKVISSVVAILAIILTAIIAINQASKVQNGLSGISPELAKAMTYPEVGEGEDAVSGTDNVKFDAFFLRDLNGDGYAESIRGTSKEIGGEDTLYMELNVQTAGYLKDAKIAINGENFYLQTALPKDNELKDNYVGNNTKEIEFNQINNGTQKLLTGVVRSGDYSYTSSKADAIGNNINNYSKVNSVTLTGTYVGEDGTETPIEKTVEFNIDWYGTTKASIYTTNQDRNIENAINEEEGTINLDFTVYTEEIAKELILSKNHIEGTIPKLNDYAPIEVVYTGSNGVFNYDAETMTFTLDRTATVDESGNVTSGLSRTNSYGIKVVYPIEAYQSLGTEAVTIKIPVKTYYEGYNNPSEEFTNPYKSNTVSATIVASYEKPVEHTYASYFDVTVGKYVYEPAYRYIVSKQKPLRIYNGESEEETDDTYTVTWRGYVGTNAKLDGMTMKETKDGEEQVTDEFIKTDASQESMDDVASNVGIYFSGADSILGENGEIKVYDEDTGNLLVTFTQKDWNKYTANNPYRYEIPVKHIRVETSALQKNEASLYVYNIKEIDDDKITTKYTREEFDKLQYIKSTLVGYIAGEYVGTDTHQANYEAPISVAEISISKNTISTQSTEKNEKITIQAYADQTANQVKWQNGTFLVKLPEEIIDAEVNNVTINNPQVILENVELIEQDGISFIKIVTKNTTPQTFQITIDVDLSPDPRIATTTKQIELYATNENGSDYYYKAQDIYDVNNNLNTEEMVNYRTTSLSMVSPNSLLTNQTATDYDDQGSEVVSPEIADIKPVYAVVDQEQPEEQTAKIGVQVKNNYASTISEIEILGKIPFEGNTYVISNADLGSTFTTKMTNAGIEVPAELNGIATVYYSDNENPDRDISKAENNWKTQDQVENWDNIKTFLIDLGDYVMPTGKEFVFNYTVKIPNGLEFNQVSFSHHGVYFCLDTDQGKYRTETEPNKLGFRIAEKYDLELTKYQIGKDKLVSGATYSITEITKEGSEETRGESKTAVTNSQGKLTISNLYAEKEYEIREINSPDDYELNENVIRFIGHVDEEGNLSIEKTEGITKGEITVAKEEGENYKVNVQVEDEVKASIKITKKEEGTENKLQGVRFKLTGYNLSETGISLTTNENGELTFNGLSVNQEYTLQEVKAEGYYLANPITFKIVNNNGNYTIEKVQDETEGTEQTINQTTTEEDGIPTINIILEDEKIPTYDLQLIKVKKTTESTVSEDELIAKAETALADTEVEYLAGAKFKLYKGTEEIGAYTTDERGKVTIEGLYQYETEKDIDQTYTLKEVLAPAGYAKVKDITFKVEEKDGTLVLTEINEYGEEIAGENYTAEGNTIKLTIEDSPSFKLIKKDAETQSTIPNVKFAIYNVDNGEVSATDSKGEAIGTKETINGKEYYTVSTDENGEITADLPEGLYKAVEVEAPEQYDISNSTYYFGIGASRENPTTMGVEFATSVGESSDDYIYSVASTSDGGVIAGGYFNSDEIQLGEYTLTSSGMLDGMIIKYSSTGEVEWARSVGGSGIDTINSVATTRDGGYIAGGDYNSDEIEVGDYKLTNSDHDDGMIIKYSSTGEVEWARSVGGNYDDRIQSVAETSDGGYIVGGYFNSSSIEVGDSTLTNNSSSTIYDDGMIIKYSREGEVEWARSVGGNYDDRIQSVAETSDGGVIAGGYFCGSIQVGEYTLTNSGGSDGMIIKYSAEGEVEWVRSVGGNDDDYIYSIAETSDVGYIAGGNFNSDEIEVGDSTLTNKRNSDGMIIKCSSTGEVEWARSVGGSNDDEIISVAQTKDGGYIAGGRFGSSIQVGDYKLTNSGLSDGMIIKFSEKELINVDITKAEGIGGGSYDYIVSVAETSDEGYIAGGYFESSSIQVGDYTLINSDEYNAIAEGMIIKYSREGEVEWARSVGGSRGDQINSVSETSDGGVIAGGYFYSTSIQVGEYTLTNNSSSTSYSDGMLIKYSASGEVEWARSVGGSSGDEINSVASTSDGGVIAGGYFRSDEIQVGDYTLTNSGGNDGMLIKYSAEGEVEWARSLGGSSGDEINSVASTSDGGVIAGGYFRSSSIQVGEYTLMNMNSGNSDGMLIKYSAEGEVEWARSVGGSGIEQITSVVSTSDGGYIAGGDFRSSSIQVGEYTLTNSNSGNSDGMLIKYSAEGEVEWARSVGGSSEDYIYSVASTSDGGYIAGGYFGSSSIQVGDYTLTNSGVYNGMVIKYSAEGEVEWATSVGGSISDYINSVAVTSDGGVIAGGYFQSRTIEAGRFNIENKGGNDGLILKLQPNTGVPEIQELAVENSRKEFKITTDVKEIDGVKGGTISGEDKNPYEKVKYGENSTNEIKMTPDENYEIISITVNGEEYPFTANEDGTYTMPQFTNMTEDKHIEVTYALKDNKLTINKVDSKTKTPLTGATFKIDQIEERTEPENIIGEVTANGQEYATADTTNEMTDAQGELTNNGTYYFVQNEEGMLIPTNGKTYQTENGGSAGKQSTTANSYIPIDLSGLEGQYVVVVNAQVSSESADYGYAIINQSTNAPSYSTSTGRFMYISGTSSSVATEKDYTSTTLEGGQTYYLHLGYRKDSSVDKGDDQVVIKSIKIYKAKTTTYNFIENNKGGYESNNQGQDDTVANSYIPIDLTNNTGKYNLIVNAKVSSQSSDYGYATVTTSTDRVAYNTNTTDKVRFIYISGEQDSQDYTTVLQGGQMYYLHLGYYKNSSTSSGEDKFTVNGIKVTLNDSELYHTEVTTDSKGQGIVQLPFGKYQITETKAPEGYELKEEPTIIEFRADGDNHEITIENQEKAKVIVHHYLKDNEGNYTTTKVAEDELLEGKIGTEYTTTPHLDLQKYELEKDENGSYVIPENAKGSYESGTIEITYYYEEKEYPLIVHHYIEGTTEQVTLATGEKAQDEEYKGKEGEEYTTEAISDEELDSKYELVETPENASGTYATDETIVTYYYKLAQRPLTITKLGENEELLEGIKFTIKNTETQETNEYTTDAQGKITLTLPVGEYEITEIETQEDYDLPENPTQTIQITKEKETYELTINNEKKQGTVITHYYIEGTEEKVPSTEEGKVVEDVIQTGKVGEIYATKEAENVSTKYKLVEVVGNTSGEYIEGTQEVIYYYKLNEGTVLVHHYKENTTESLSADETIVGEIGSTYETNPAEDIPANYEVVATPENATGEIVEGQTVVTYYYRLKTPDILNPQITKESNVEKVTDPTQEVNYTINYQTTIDKYIGEATVTITDKLPYEIDESKSNIAGGTYNAVEKTITWEETIEDIDTFTNGTKNINITKEITLVYKDLDVTQEKVTNKVTGTINLKTPEKEQTVEDTKEIPAEYLVNIPVTKVWDDNNNVAQKRPEKITVKITGNGKEYTQELTKSNVDSQDANRWTYTFTGLPRYDEDGEEIDYIVSENPTGSIFYTEGNSKVEQETKTITNTFEVPNETIGIPVTKVWNDNNNVANKRPANVTIVVEGDQNPTIQGNEITKEYTLTEANKNESNANEWKYVFEDLPKYDIYGNEITYTVTEKATGNIFYTEENTEVTGDQKQGYTVTNTFEVPNETVDVPVTKIWADNNNEANRRPADVTVTVEGDQNPTNIGNEISKEYTLTEANKNADNTNEWTYTFEDLPKYDIYGDEIEYTINEKGTNSEFYQKTNVDQEERRITNTFVVPGDKITIPVEKVWQDNDNKANKRPTSVTIQVKNGEEVVAEEVLSEANNWKYEFQVPKYDDLGKEITYTVEEKDLGNIFYTSENTEITGNQEEGFTVTNTFEVPDEKVQVPVTKVWNDNNNTAQKRPERITVILEGDQNPETEGNEIKKEYTLTGENKKQDNENEWIYTFEDLPKYDTYGNEIEYTVKEESTGSIFYTESNTTITGDTETGYTITNTFEVPDTKIMVLVSKIWDDNSNIAEKRPTSIKVTLTGTPTIGKKITKEAEITTQDVNAEDENRWDYIFENLPKYDANGNEIVYTVEEQDLNNIFYTQENTKVTGDQKEGYVITNTFEVPNETVEVPVTKVWNDNNNIAQKRPENVTVIVEGDQNPTTDGNEVSKEYTLTEANKNDDNTNEWTYTFEDLPKYDIYGNEIKYTVTEKATGSIFYTEENTEITGDQEQGFTVTNTFEVPDEKIQVPVTKIWNDSNNTANKRPENVTITVEGDQDPTQEGNEVSKEYTLTEANKNEINENEWTYTFEDLPKYDIYGNEIEYTIDEKGTNSEFYQKTSVNQEERTITNSFVVPGDTIEIPVTKIWDDNNNTANKRPEKVTLVLSGNGIDYEQTLTVSNANIADNSKWEYTFTNLPKYDANGDEIEYTLSEKDLNNKFYTSENTKINQEEKTVTNTFKVPDEKIEITVNKVWEDNDIQEQRRPESIILVVKNGSVEVARQEINSSNEVSGNKDNWQFTFTNLPKYDANGDEIEYTVDELEKTTNDLHFYEKNITEVTNVENETNKKQATITNTFKTPDDTTNITVNKIWNDKETQSARRPESIIIMVKNGENVIQEKEVTKANELQGKENQWTVTFEGLPKYDENGQEIKYTVDEKEKNTNDLYFYDKEITEVQDNQATIRNTFVKPDDTINLTVTKNWEDNNNENNKRPTAIKVEVKVEGQTVKEQIINKTNEVSGNSNEWRYTFEDLPKYNENGEKIEYTVEESAIGENDLEFYDKAKITGDMETGYIITNTFKVPDTKISVTVNKTWVDHEIQEQRRPESVVLVLSKKVKVEQEEGTKEELQEVARQEITLSNAISGNKDKWQYTFENLPKYDENGNVIEYTVEEQEKAEGDLHFYNTQIGAMVDKGENGDREITITNTFTRPEDQTEVVVTKIWDDNNNEAEKRPESIKLQLKNGNSTIKEQEITEANKVEGQEKEDIINKVNENKELTEQISSNTVEVWQYTFTGIQKYDENGQELKYTADETEVHSSDLQFYTKELQGTTIINKFTQNTDKTSVTVTKKWVDNEVQEQRRPESIIIQVKNGMEVVASYEMTEADKLDNDKDTWQYTFEDLPKYDAFNNIINYTVDEIEKTSGDLSFYSKEINGTTITNTFVKPQDKIQITVNKEWVDQDDVYKKRPDTINLQVKNGEEVIAEKTVSKEDNWEYTFTNLDKYDENGQEINYTVDEEETKTGDLFYYEKEIGEVINNEGTESGKQATITNRMTKLPSLVIVKYVDINTDEEIEDRVNKEGIVGETFDVTEDKKDIPGYTLVEEPEEKTGTYTEETQVKTYYYAKNTKVIVKYLEKDDTPEDDADNKVLSEQITIEGYEGKSYSTEKKTIEGYTYVESKGKTSGKMEKDTIEVVYYYAPNTKVIVKYLEKDNTPNDNTDNKVLAPEETINGYVGEKYDTEQKTITNYTFIESTDNTEGTMTKDTIEVIYYYAQNTKVTVKYLEKDNTPSNTDNKVLAKEEIIEGYEGQEYKTEQKDIENYVFVESTNNTEGTMTKDEIEVIYYYAQKTKAKVEHIDRETGEILKEETKEGKVGDIFETHPEDFEGYILVESPKEPNIIMDKTGEQVVKYYYAHVSAGVIEKHIDEITGELLYSEEHKGNEGDSYDIPSRNFDGYDLLEKDEDGTNRLPENAKGEMTKEVIEVKYYYIKRATVRVEYIDKETGEKLTEDITIEGHEGDSYETEEKEFKDYNLVETPENAKGEMTVTKNEDGTWNTETTVTYYYEKAKKDTTVVEKHIDINTNKVLAEETHKGKVGDSYDIPSREFEGYELVTEDENGNNMLPENSKGTMTEEEIEVIYYYEKQATVKVEYIDKQTGEKLDEEEIKGHVGDPYETEEKEFDGYELVEVPSNSTGEMTEEEIVVKYYYQRKAEVEVQYLEKDTDYKLAENDNITGYVGDKYETEPKDIPYYKLVDQTENTEGTMTKEKITVIYYYEKQLFNLSVDKWVSGTTINGIPQLAQNYNSRDELYKIDIHRSKVETADVKITYTIRITNTGEIEGTADRITELIPQGYTYNQEDNSIYWQESNGILTTDALKDEMIKPGEYKDIEIVLRWSKGENNFGQKDNTVILSSETNPAGYEDINEEDNSDKSEMLLTVATGLDSTDRVVVIGIIEVVLVISVGLLLSYKKKEHKK